MNIQALLRFAKRADRLESLPRSGWLFGGVVAPESVAAHSYQTTLIALYLAEHVDADVEKVMKIALLHDIAESLMTDLPRPTKDFIGGEAVKLAEGRAATHVLDAMPPSWLAAFREYEDAQTLEARVVKAADRIQMMIKACIYEAQTRGDVARFFEIEDTDYDVPGVLDILDEIRAMRAAGSWNMSDLD